MKSLHLSWQPSKRVERLPIVNDSDPAYTQLPFEIWRKIIAYVVRLAGADSVDLEDPFAPPSLNEEYPEVDPGVFTDRRSISLVCAAWRSVVAEISAEYLVIYSVSHLKSLVKQFQLEFYKRKLGKKRVGERTLRIDFKILQPYKPMLAVRLFRCCPNLLVYINKNGPLNQPARCTPMEVIRGLVAFCSKTLQRVEWAGPGEPPRYQDLVLLCNNLPNLRTLRLVSVYTFPFPDSIHAPPLLVLPHVRTLSLGVIPEPNELKPEYAVTWDPFLRYMSMHKSQLPSLERFECDIFPTLTMSFFLMHGHKIKVFRSTTWSTETALPEAVAACPNLQSLVILHGSEAMDFPVFHPTLKKICILPTIDVAVEVPQRVFKYAVMAPLDFLLKTIERIEAPHLVELRVRNSGAFSKILDQKAWLNFWRAKWGARGVQFCDMSGMLYGNAQNSPPAGEDPLDFIEG
ncbi:hypothetical protein NLJ89_g2461 [Agrocybe chaxingu]|uniref:Uncharacterized protein n=1 Tax=Agrocybe chaxingu TaxID=84603 RepID=A0A9W8K7G5_9AGAR|nr:hypothetical protein NLJ89_g2461 [Agrocybe chaxingu]